MFFFLDCTVASMNIISNKIESLMGLNGSKTLEFFYGLFFSGMGNDANNNIVIALKAAGLVLLYGIFLFQLFKGLFGPLAKAESPFKLLLKTSLFALLVSYSHAISGLFFDLGTMPYKTLLEIVEKSSGATWQGGHNLGTIMHDALKDDSRWFTEGVPNMLWHLEAEIYETLATVVITFSIMINYMKLTIEIVERYIILGVLALFAPICIATGASESTDNIFKSWIRMMFSQCILIFMSSFFIAVFTGTMSGNIWAGMNVYNDPLIIMLALLAWLRTGQRIDSHMSTLGLTTAQSGGGLYADMWAGSHLAGKVIGGAAKSGIAGVAIGRNMSGKDGTGSKKSFKEAFKNVMGGATGRALNPALHNAINALALSKGQSPFSDAASQQLYGGGASGAKAYDHLKEKYGDVEDSSTGMSAAKLEAAGASPVPSKCTLGPNGSGTLTYSKDGKEYTLSYGQQDGKAVASFKGDSSIAPGITTSTAPSASNGGNNQDLSTKSQMLTAADGTQIGGALNGGNLRVNSDSEVVDKDNNPFIDSNGDTIKATDVSYISDDGKSITKFDKNGNSRTLDAGIVSADNASVNMNGSITDISAAYDKESGSFRTNKDGFLVDADNNVLTNDQNAPISADSLIKQDGNNGYQTYDVADNQATIGNAVSQAPTYIGTTDNGVFSANGQSVADLNAAKNENGQLTMPDGTQFMTAALARNGEVFSVDQNSNTTMEGLSAAMDVNGNVHMNENGDLLNAQTGTTIMGADGKAMNFSNVTTTQIGTSIGANNSISTDKDGNIVNSSGEVQRDKFGQTLSGYNVVGAASFASSTENASSGANTSNAIAARNSNGDVSYVDRTTGEAISVNGRGIQVARTAQVFDQQPDGSYTFGGKSADEILGKSSAFIAVNAPGASTVSASYQAATSAEGAYVQHQNSDGSISYKSVSSKDVVSDGNGGFQYCPTDQKGNPIKNANGEVMSQPVYNRTDSMSSGGIETDYSGYGNNVTRGINAKSITSIKDPDSGAESYIVEGTNGNQYVATPISNPAHRQTVYNSSERDNFVTANVNGRECTIRQMNATPEFSSTLQDSSRTSSPGNINYLDRKWNPAQEKFATQAGEQLSNAGISGFKLKSANDSYSKHMACSQNLEGYPGALVMGSSTTKRIDNGSPVFHGAVLYPARDFANGENPGSKRQGKNVVIGGVKYLAFEQDMTYDSKSHKFQLSGKLPTVKEVSHSSNMSHIIALERVSMKLAKAVQRLKRK